MLYFYWILLYYSIKQEKYMRSFTGMAQKSTKNTKYCLYYLIFIILIELSNTKNNQQITKNIQNKRIVLPIPKQNPIQNISKLRLSLVEQEDGQYEKIEQLDPFITSTIKSMANPPKQKAKTIKMPENLIKKLRSQIQTEKNIKIVQNPVPKYQKNQQILLSASLTYNKYAEKYKPQSINQNNQQTLKYRSIIFKNNLNRISSNNAKSGKAYVMGINVFSDLQEQQFNRVYARLLGPNDPYYNIQLLDNSNLQWTAPPKISIDWRCKASFVLAQGVCLSGYAISALEAITITARIYNHDVNFLSVQQIISCGKGREFINGCEGGFYSGVYQYAAEFGIGQSSKYFYDDEAKFKGIESKCSAYIESNQYNKKRVFIKQYNSIKYGDCAEVVNQLKFRALSVAIAAYGLQHYKSGTFQTKNTNINHAVVLVGYNPEKGYLIKNSWGIAWGDQGYGYVGQSTGVCLLAMYPLIKDESKFGSCSQ